MEPLWSLQGFKCDFRVEMASLFPVYSEPHAEMCPRCHYFDYFQIDSFRWSNRGNQISDFIGCDVTRVVREEVADDLIARFSGIMKREFHFLDNPRCYNTYNSREKRIWLPYTGPELCELILTHEISLLPQSTIISNGCCPECGREEYIGIKGLKWPSKRTPCPIRSPKSGLFIAASEVENLDFFRPVGTCFCLCRDSVRQFIEKKAYTNAFFWDVGAIVQ